MPFRDRGELISFTLLGVSKKNVDLFLNWYNSFIFQGIFPKFSYGHNKLILLCSEEESICSSTSARSYVIMTSDCIYDNIVFSSAQLKTQMVLSETIISSRTFSFLHFKESRL